MGKEAEFKKSIQNLYKRGHLETALFSWINCARYMFSTVSVDAAIMGFYKYYGIAEEEYPLNTARLTYYRMQKELIQLEKDESKRQKEASSNG